MDTFSVLLRDAGCLVYFFIVNKKETGTKTDQKVIRHKLCSCSGYLSHMQILSAEVVLFVEGGTARGL